MRLNVRVTKLLRIATLLNIRGFYYCGCWERIDMADHLVPGILCNWLISNEALSVSELLLYFQYKNDNGVKGILWHLFFTILQHLLNLISFVKVAYVTVLRTYVCIYAIHILYGSQFWIVSSKQMCCRNATSSLVLRNCVYASCHLYTYWKCCTLSHCPVCCRNRCRFFDGVCSWGLCASKPEETLS